MTDNGEDLIDEGFVDECWKAFVTKVPRNDKDIMGAHNRQLAKNFLKYSRDKGAVAAYVLQLYTYKATVDRAKSINLAWRIGLAIPFAALCVYYLAGYLNAPQDLKSLYLTGGAVYLLALAFVVPGLSLWYWYLERKEHLLIGPSARPEPDQTGTSGAKLDTGLLGIWMTVYISIYVFFVAGPNSHSLFSGLAIASFAGALGFGLLLPFKFKRFQSAFSMYFRWIENEKGSWRTFILPAAFIVSTIVFFVLLQLFG